MKVHQKPTMELEKIYPYPSQVCDALLKFLWDIPGTQVREFEFWLDN